MTSPMLMPSARRFFHGRKPLAVAIRDRISTERTGETNSVAISMGDLPWPWVVSDLASPSTQEWRVVPLN